MPKCVSRLQKLQILKLKKCRSLSCLPKELTQLQDLRHLIIIRCESLVAMPPKIGELKCLKTLSIFIVDSEEGFRLAELGDLQLGGKLHIKGLENVRNECDARDANLINKKNLIGLYLSWNGNANSQCDSVERVLEALEPHSSLKSFGMNGYAGTQLASWMRNASLLSGLVDVILYNCKNCVRLPPLGKLPLLANLFVCGMKDVKHIDDDSYDGVEEKALKSLKKLSLYGLPSLERMLRDERVEMLPLLSQLTISDVPKFELPPRLLFIELLSIEGTALLPEGIMYMPNIKSLSVKSFHKLKELPNGFDSLNVLQHLDFVSCDELESFSENVLQGLSSLRTLRIWFCEKLKSLSEGMGHLTCLERLEIYCCPELVTLPSNVNQLTALRDVTFGGERQRSTLPEGLQRIPSLQSLTIMSVESLPEWLGDMTSVQQLRIILCSALGSLPSSFQRLTNLRELYIEECPQLEKRCKKETGEDWQNIAHIPQFKLVPGDLPTFCGKFIFFILLSTIILIDASQLTASNDILPFVIIIIEILDYCVQILSDSCGRSGR